MRTRDYEVHRAIVDGCMAGMVSRDGKLVHKRKIATSFVSLRGSLPNPRTSGHTAQHTLRLTLFSELEP